MRDQGRRAAFLAAAVVLAIAAGPGPARADVTFERYTKGSGIAGIAAAETTSAVKISGLRKRETTSMKMGGATGLGGFLNKIAGNLGTDTITDVGHDREVKLDNKAKTYTEQRIAPPEQQPMSEGDGGGGGPEGQAEKPTHRVVRNEITVDDTGEKKRIGEFDCRRYVVTWLLETEDVETKERAESTMTTDLWTTPETGDLRALRKEEGEFNRAYLKKIGLDVSDEEMQQFGIAAIAAMFGGDDASLEKGMKEVSAKMKKIKGFPIGTRVVWRVKQTATAPGGTKMEQKEGLPDLGKSLDSLMSVFGKKKKEEKKEAKAEGGASEKQGPPAFESYSELRSVSTDKIPSADFEVPAGYKKVAP